MVNFPWLTVHLVCSRFCCMLKILSICIKLLIVTVTSLHFWIWCTSVLDSMSSLVTFDLVLCLPRRGPVVSLFFSRTPFARFQTRIVISHTCLNFGAYPFGVLSKTLNCSLAWCASSHDFCRAPLRLIGMRLCGSVFLCEPPTHPSWVMFVCVQGADSLVMVPFVYILDSCLPSRSLPACWRSRSGQHSVIANLTPGITVWVPHVFFDLASEHQRL